MPKLKESIDNAHESVTRHGYVKSMSGRRRRFSKNSWGKYSSGAYRQAYNFLIQGYSADMIRMALIKVREESKKNPEWDLKIIGTVHDEGIMEVNTKYKEIASKTIQDSFQSVVKFCVPVVGDIGIGGDYSEAK